MTKVSVTGSKKELEAVIQELYDLEILDIDDYSGELETGSPFEEGEDISQLLVDVRSLISKLPEVDEKEEEDISLSQLQDKLPELTKEIEETNDEIAQLERKSSSIREQRNFFEMLEGTKLNFEDLQGTKTLDVFIGELDSKKLREKAPNTRFEIFEGEEAKVVFYSNNYKEEFEEVLREVAEKEHNTVETDLEGRIDDILERIADRKKELESELEWKKEELEELSHKWKGVLENTEEFLTEKVEKAEAPIRFATTQNAFIAQGWIPSKRFGEVEEKLAEATDGRIHVQTEEGEEPPVKHENPRPVQPFESLTDLVSVPKYNELDPSFMIFLTFPLFFGFMIGDFGYGLTSFAVFYAGYKKFSEAKQIFISLMYASVATMFFGLIFGDAFGFIIFGSDSVLTELTGMQFFSQIPVLFHRAHRLGQVFMISALIGVVHVNLGYLLGFYNEHIRHGFKEAFLEKGSWLMLEAGIALWYLFGIKAGAPVLAISVALLYLGEGVEGVVEIPSLLSNVLSYLRIFGVSVAAVSLAAVVNGLATPLFQSGSILGIILGITFLVIGHVFNTFIKIIEGFLQGIRLHYVELFSKFYEGGGRKYAPFGASS